MLHFHFPLSCRFCSPSVSHTHQINPSTAGSVSPLVCTISRHAQAHCNPKNRCAPLHAPVNTIHKVHFRCSAPIVMSQAWSSCSTPACQACYPSIFSVRYCSHWTQRCYMMPMQDWLKQPQCLATCWCDRWSRKGRTVRQIKEYFLLLFMLLEIELWLKISSTLSIKAPLIVRYYYLLRMQFHFPGMFVTFLFAYIVLLPIYIF
jgi:hypothetical protein